MPVAALRSLSPMMLALLIGAAVAACGRGPGGSGGSGGAGGANTGPLRVVVSIAPLKGLVEPLVPAIHGKAAEVSLLVPIGAMEHGYEIPPAMMAQTLHADVVVYVGLGLEPQLEKMLRQNPSPTRHEVCFAEVAGIRTPQRAEPAGEHDEHAHGGIDPHLWLDPLLVEKLIPAVRRAVEEAAASRGVRFSETDPDRPSVAEMVLLTRVRDIDNAYKAELADLRGRALITAHAAWGRLADRYELVQAPLAGLEASEPTPAALARAVQTMREHGATTIFTEPQMNAGAAQRLAETAGSRLATLDPLGTGDWFGMMQSNLDAIVAGLTPPVAPAPSAPPAPHK